MARGTELAAIRRMVLAEIGDNDTPNDLRIREINTLLSNKQKLLSYEYNWPFLQHQWDAPCPSNTQYVDIPTQDIRGVDAVIDWERLVDHSGLWNTFYNPIKYGIGVNEYNWQNFALLGQQSDPIQRFQIVSNANETVNPNQIEVWPVPVTPQTIRFAGQRELYPLIVDQDTADLDDMLLVYFVAADMLMRKKQADAQSKLSQAKEILGRLLRMYPSRQQSYVLGQPTITNRRRPDGSRLIAVASRTP